MKQLIEQVKLNLNSRSSPLFLDLEYEISTKMEINLHQMLEKEINEGLVLKVRSKQGSCNIDYAEALTQINEEKHPILHRYVTMKAS